MLQLIPAANEDYLIIGTNESSYKTWQNMTTSSITREYMQYQFNITIMPSI